MKKLRILVVLPLYGGSLPIGQYCTRALRDMGHFVEEFDAPAFHPADMALRNLRVDNERLEQLESAFVNLLSQAIYAKVETFQPDLVLALAQAPLNRQILRRLQKDGVPTAMWFVEDYSIFGYWRAFASYYDFFFVIQKEPFLSMLPEAGAENACYLPMAALPSFHQPLALSPADMRQYGAELAFLGAGYPNRRQAFRAFVGRNFKIWGSDWDGDSVLAPCVQNGGARISPEDSVKIYNATDVNLNLHSSIKADTLVSGGDFVNPRTFELASMGVFQLVDKRSLMPEMFTLAHVDDIIAGQDAQAELAIFDDTASMERGIRYFLDHPEAREAFAKRAQTRVLQEHTYTHRMQTMLDFIAQRRPGWPADNASLPDELSDTMREQVSDLLNRLQLPPTAPFNDVITRLRQESGVLGSLETILLFLDEWRKQYKV